MILLDYQLYHHHNLIEYKNNFLYIDHLNNLILRTMKKIIITGGLGYIGTELCKIYSGYSWKNNIIVIDNRFISERVNQIRNWNMNFIQGDVLDKELMRDKTHLYLVKD